MAHEASRADRIAYGALFRCTGARALGKIEGTPLAEGRFPPPSVENHVIRALAFSLVENLPYADLIDERVHYRRRNREQDYSRDESDQDIYRLFHW
jgi:hypothetical protein